MRLLSSCVIAVAFRFRPILHFSVARFVVPLTLFYAHQHPLGFFINAAA